MVNDRKRFYRLAFCVNDVPEGTMLMCEKNIEMAISHAAQTIGKGFSVHSVNPIFMSDAEEHDFLHFIVQGNQALSDDIVNIQDRLSGKK